MKKLGCAQCGKVVKSLSKAQKGKITNVPDRGDNSENYKYGNKDKWGRPTTSKWYGFNPKTKKYEYKAGGVSIQLPKYSNDPRTNQGRILQDGGMTSTSRQLTRLGKKVKRKMDDGKTISKGLQKRYDKAADKVIAKGFKAKRGGTKK